jgi:ribosomal protein L7Ae-like RNA K-turn-binding protein
LPSTAPQEDVSPERIAAVPSKPEEEEVPFLFLFSSEKWWWICDQEK